MARWPVVEATPADPVERRDSRAVGGSDEPRPGELRDRRWSFLPWTVLGFVLVEAALRTWFDLAGPGGRSDLEWGVFLYPFLSFPVVGAVLASKRPRNPLGWLMLAIGVGIAIPGVPYARYATVSRQGHLPGAGLAVAAESPMWVVFIGLSGFLLLLFPDGRLPSRRWRWFGRACALGLVLLFVLILVSPGQGEDYGLPDVRNPLAIGDVDPFGGPLALLALFAPLSVLGGAVGMIGRIRRTRRETDPVLRQQLRWLAWSAGVIALLYASAFLPQAVFGLPRGSTAEDVLSSVAVPSFVLIPITTGIAVLRYRLFDIDIVIKKTVVFAALAASIAIVYGGLVVGVGAAVGSRRSPLLSAAAAAIVALVFQPVRSRARRLADHVVYGRRATPYEVLADFSERVGETYAADDVLPRMARVVAEGIGAQRAEVWLRLGDGDRLAAVWPSDATPSGSPGAAGTAFPVEHQGQVLGWLAVVAPANDPMTPEKAKLVTDLAGQAGLVLRNVRLTEDLRARLDELRAAQKRLVTAQDDERRRLERNIHDGAQQQLVSMAVKLRLADRLVDRSPPEAHAALAELQAEAAVAVEDLRDLARGIYPPLLADQGLAPALSAQARRSSVPVEVDVRLSSRLTSELEAAVYFSCLECLQNVAKYANASRATLSVTLQGGDVVFEVTDDGRGFDTTSTGYGTGLQGIADRLGALQGSVEVRSSPGLGTSVRGRLPTPLS